MGLIPLICPNCKANLTVDENSEVYFCQYCGSRVVDEKQKIELSGSVNVMGMATDKTLLEKARIQLKGGEYEEAEETLERVLDINPRCSEAYLGKLLARLKLSDKSELIDFYMPINDYVEYKNAYTYGNDSQKKELEDISNGLNKALLDSIGLPVNPNEAPRSDHSLWMLGCVVCALIPGVLIGVLTKVFLMGAIVFVVALYFMVKKTKLKYIKREQDYKAYLKKKEIYETAISDIDAYKKRIFNQKYSR